MVKNEKTLDTRASIQAADLDDRQPCYCVIEDPSDEGSNGRRAVLSVRLSLRDIGCDDGWHGVLRDERWRCDTTRFRVVVMRDHGLDALLGGRRRDIGDEGLNGQYDDVSEHDAAFFQT